MASSKSCALAQLNMGNCYFLGRGVEKDYQQAVYWYERAAAQGLDVAQFNLAQCYENGTGVARDDAKAATLYSKSAAQGNVMAINNLAGCYYLGKGVAQNKEQAFALWSQAKGYSYAQQNLGLRYSNSKACLKAQRKQEKRAINRWVHIKY